MTGGTVATAGGSVATAGGSVATAGDTGATAGGMVVTAGGLIAWPRMNLSANTRVRICMDCVCLNTTSKWHETKQLFIRTA